MSSADPRVQLRFTYQPPSKSLRLRGEIRGVFIEVTPEDGDLQAAQSYMHALGAQTRPDSGSLLLPAQDAGLLLDLPERVVLLAAPELATLLRCLGPTVLPPVVVSLDSPQVVNLNWVDETGECNEPLHIRSVAALLASNVLLSASPEVWELLVSARTLPMNRARARLNLDGFVEITTSLGRHVEAADVPGLFKIDTGRYGLSAALAPELERIPGVLWEGPRRFAGDLVLPAPSLPLGPHSAPLLSEFLHSLELSRAAVVCSPPGSGRRLFSLAACESLRATPILVLCRPASLWLWHRHIDLLSGGGELATVTVLSYDALSAADLPDVSSVVFDDLDLALTEHPDLVSALRRVSEKDPEFLIAVLRNEPAGDDSLLTILSLVRPSEFNDRVPLLARYPGDATSQFARHAGVFLHKLPPAPTPLLFKSSTVLEIPAPQMLLESFLSRPPVALTNARGIRERAAEFLSWSSAGTAALLGPKIATVLAMMPAEGSAVVTRMPRTAQLLEDLGVTAKGAALIDPSSPLGDLSSYRQVVLLEPPFSYRDLDRAVVESSDSRGVPDVVVLHAPGTPDDRSAEVAFLRRRGGDGALSLTEASFIAGLCGYKELLR